MYGFEFFLKEKKLNVVCLINTAGKASNGREDIGEG